MKIDDICRQLESLSNELRWEYHKKDCPYFIYHTDGGDKCLPDSWAINFNPIKTPLDLCNCDIRKHTKKIMILKTQIQDALELFGIETKTTLCKYYGDK